MKELSCVIDFWKIQLNAIRACMCCKVNNKNIYPPFSSTLRNKDEHHTLMRPAISTHHKKHDAFEDEALLSSYDLV